MTLLRMVRWLSLIAALGSLIVLAQTLSKKPTDRQCERSKDGAPCSLHGMRMPGLSLQLANSTYEVGQIAHTRVARDSLLRSNRHDYFVIAVYCSLFVGIGLLIGRNSPTVGALVVACTIGAATLDVAENILIAGELTTNDITPVMVQHVWWTASGKWLLVFIVTAALSTLFLRRESIVWKMVGIALIAAAFIGVHGLVLYRPSVEQALLLILGGIVCLGSWLLFAPQQFMAAETD